MTECGCLIDTWVGCMSSGVYFLIYVYGLLCVIGTAGCLYRFLLFSDILSKTKLSRVLYGSVCTGQKYVDNSTVAVPVVGLCVLWSVHVDQCYAAPSGCDTAVTGALSAPKSSRGSAK